MSLKFVVDSVDGLSTETAALYTKNADGKFYLEVEGAVPKAKLDEFRDTNVRVLKELEKFKDVDLTKYQEMLDLSKKAAEKKLIEAGDVDKIVEARIGEMHTTYTADLAKLTNDNKVAQRQLEALLIDSAVREAAMKSGVQPTAVDDVLLRAKSVFQLKDGVSIPLDSSGKIIYGKDGVSPMTVADWTAGLKKTAPHLFQGSQGGGAQGPGKLNSEATAKLSAAQKITMGLDSL